MIVSWQMNKFFPLNILLSLSLSSLFSLMFIIPKTARLKFFKFCVRTFFSLNVNFIKRMSACEHTFKFNKNFIRVKCPVIIVYIKSFMNWQIKIGTSFSYPLLAGVITLLTFSFKKVFGFERAKDWCSAKAMKKKLPDIWKATVTGGGHWINWEGMGG